MGASNVAKVFINWSKSELTHRDLVALIFMANVALDADEPPVYFGGWDSIADALGDEGDALAFKKDPYATAEQLRKAKAVEEKVRRVMKSLVKAGAIVSAGDARNSTNADYALCLDPGISYRPSGRIRTEKGRYRMSWAPVDSPVSPTKKVGQVSTEKVGQEPPNKWGNFHRKGGDSPTEKVGPMNKDEPYEEYRDEPINRLLDASLEGRKEIFAAAQDDDDSQNSTEDEYDAARDHLQTLEDHGTKLLAAVEESNPDLSLTQRVIEAANLARQRKGNAA
ncbi:hypothetical protein OF385_02610 [Glutamicibacter sp. JL.03c]|uniref:hypothetical protein n=1 Tax=Glutamicibacter sp. JL.03c TaxID=2984842 RepID=UPI0021F7B32D|nr:hypothetical protein [Glutamicibacter sp. JL.03c]UYQ78081.1 hypothetical protein OF385_02610 [Glutamicibacter sp. JL.03c]